MKIQNLFMTLVSMIIQNFAKNGAFQRRIHWFGEKADILDGLCRCSSLDRHHHPCHHLYKIHQLRQMRRAPIAISKSRNRVEFCFNQHQHQHHLHHHHHHHNGEKHVLSHAFLHASCIRALAMSGPRSIHGILLTARSLELNHQNTS